MLRRSIAGHRWPKRHVHVVEECTALSVRDILCRLDPHDRATLPRWHPPRHPALTLVARQTGAVRRWWLRCRTCGECCEALFIPPNVSGDDWRCRHCWNLIHASQRYGRRHPLRQVLSPRKLTMRAKAEARRVREEAKARREWEERCRLAALETEERREEAETREADRAREAMRRDVQRQVRAMLEADAAENQMYLDAIKNGDLSPRSLQGQAALMLERVGRRFGI